VLGKFYHICFFLGFCGWKGILEGRPLKLPLLDSPAGGKGFLRGDPSNSP
jgi:hypothetical protein